MAADVTKQSWREADFSLNGGAVTTVDFLNTEPNHAIITNNTTGSIYISESANVSPSNYILTIPANGKKIYTTPKGFKRLYIFSNGVTGQTAHIQSFQDTFNPTTIVQTTETVQTTNTTGSVSIQGSLPAGNNIIGQVKLTDGTDQLQINTDGSLGNDQIGYTAVKVTAAAAGDQTVKNAAGKVASIRPVTGSNVYLKDGTNQIWDAITGGNSEHFHYPVQCNTSIVLNFSAAGTAYIVYK